MPKADAVRQPYEARADGEPLSAFLGRRQLGLRLGAHLLAAMRVGLRPGLLLDLDQLLAPG